jgi:Tfp pilus assembly protein PilF
VAANPNNLRAQLAYAQLLTYQEPTRVEGIRRLAALAQNPEIASAAGKAWRQALEWLPIDAPSIPAYQGWLTGHPSDGGISALMEQARNPRRTPADEAAATRSAGFAALNSGQIKEAEADFQAALAKNPQDPDALGGLGLVRLRQGNAAEARTLLSRAIAADPEHKARWEQALSGASVGEDYAAARTAVQRGQLDAAERQLRAIIARGGDVAGAQAMLADVLSRRGDLAGAEAQYRAVLARQPNNAHWWGWRRCWASKVAVPRQRRCWTGRRVPATTAPWAAFAPMRCVSRRRRPRTRRSRRRCCARRLGRTRTTRGHGSTLPEHWPRPARSWKPARSWRR